MAEREKFVSVKIRFEHLFSGKLSDETVIGSTLARIFYEDSKGNFGLATFTFYCSQT